jgi:hypothetical protein
MVGLVDLISETVMCSACGMHTFVEFQFPLPLFIQIIDLFMHYVIYCYK